MRGVLFGHLIHISFFSETKLTKLRIAIPQTQSPIDSPVQRVFWPEDYLLQDIPQARVWTYGYNANVIAGLYQANSQNSVSQHGLDFAAQIEREINNEEPIVLVAHSLGGIIVKYAINRSAPLRGRVSHIIFLGTPHRGSPYAAWGEIASNMAKLLMQDSNKKILETLEVNSELLDNIHDSFLNVIYDSGTKVHSFCEGRSPSGVKGLHRKVRVLRCNYYKAFNCVPTG